LRGDYNLSCTLSKVDAGWNAPNRERPIRLFSFGEKRLICTKLMAVISLAIPLPCDGWFQTSSAKGTFEHLALRYSCGMRPFAMGYRLGAPSQTIYPLWGLDSRKVLIRNGGNSRPTELCRLFFHLTLVTAKEARYLDWGHSASKRGHQEEEVCPLPGLTRVYAALDDRGFHALRSRSRCAHSRLPHAASWSCRADPAFARPWHELLAK